MKTILRNAAFALTLSFALPTFAQPVRLMAPVQQQNYTCDASKLGISRVSTLDAAQCCSPQSHCVEYLSTTKVDHDSKANHT